MHSFASGWSVMASSATPGRSLASSASSSSAATAFANGRRLEGRLPVQRPWMSSARRVVVASDGHTAVESEWVAASEGSSNQSWQERIACNASLPVKQISIVTPIA